MQYTNDSARKSNVLLFASHPDVISFQKNIDDKKLLSMDLVITKT